MGKLRYSFNASSHSACIIITCMIYYLFLCSNFTSVEGFDSLLQLPQSGSFRNRNRTRIRTRSRSLLYVNDYGAKGDGLSDDTKAFKKVWKAACSSTSGAKIVLPAGNSYLVRPVNFSGPCRSKLTLRISGTIVAPKDPDVWFGYDRHKWLYFHGVKHLTVEGGGIVNGMGQEWWARSCKVNKTNPCRHAPTAMTFHRCNNLKVRNLMFLNSQQMHLNFSHCLRVVASFLKVLAPAASPNTDGIHISESSYVEVKDSIIGTGDDCISIVSNSSRIRIRNIVCGPGHGISIGSLGKSKTCDQMHDISVTGAFIFNTENGVRIKTWQGGSGYARKISFQNMRMENVSNPIIIDQYYCDSPLPCRNQTSAVSIDNISFKSIKGTSATEEAIRFACSDSSPCQELYLEDIQITSFSGGVTRSFCWEAYGTTVGLVQPPTCLSSDDSIIKQRVSSTSVLWSM